MYKIICDLGFGDSGKGSVVDYFCRTDTPKYVIRYCGGHQCGHSVQLSDGTSHIFSQFGSGTLVGVPTYYGPYCIFELFSWVVEKEALYKKGIFCPNFSVDKDCLIATIYHRILNQIRELSRSNKHGSCGVGIGETRSYWLNYGFDSIFARDLSDKFNLLQKLRLMYSRLYQEALNYKNIINNSSQILQLLEEFKEFSPEFIYNRYCNTLREHDLCISNPLNVLVYSDSNLVFEGSQGVLLDENYGYQPPHVTWSTTTPKHAFDFVDQLGLDRKKCQVVGVTRSYMTRHGAGPFPSECKLDVKNEAGTVNTIFNGDMRYGLLDMDLLKYSIGVAKPDLLFVNCMDEFPASYFEDKTIWKCSPKDLINKLDKICRVGYIGYGPRHLDKIRL